MPFEFLSVFCMLLIIAEAPPPGHHAGSVSFVASLWSHDDKLFRTSVKHVQMPVFHNIYKIIILKSGTPEK